MYIYWINMCHSGAIFQAQIHVLHFKKLSYVLYFKKYYFKKKYFKLK
jgi:hypothetical protein